jgi:S1-C subfamily serine protease
MGNRPRKQAPASRRTWAGWPVAPVVMSLALMLSALALGACSSGGAATTSQAAQTTTSTGAAQATTSTAPAGHADQPEDLASPAQDVLNTVYTSVVNVNVSGQGSQGVGSGIVYTSDGLILTNDHVVTLDGSLTSGQTIVVTLSSGEHLPATIVGEDASADIAALQVKKTGLNPVTFGKSSEVQLAEWATVIGSPLDFSNSVSLGIVSGLNRTLDTGGGVPPLTGLIQLDAAISPGNSGGGCFDARGRFIGMPEVYLPPGQTGAENIGFAIPADTVARVAKTLTGR